MGKGKGVMEAEDVRRALERVRLWPCGPQPYASTDLAPAERVLLVFLAERELARMEAEPREVGR